MSEIREVIKSFCPPIIWRLLSRIQKSKQENIEIQNLEQQKLFQIANSPDKQDLDLYWTPEMAKILDEWGEDNVWNEIQLLLASCKGKVLDIACGTGKTICILEKYPALELYGCDISDLLIKKGIERGIPVDRLTVCDATKTVYNDNQFDYSYSIGSLEHFTLDGIDAFIRESHRITSIASFHMIPTSKSKKNEGWMKTLQSFFNNSDEWWMEKYMVHYSKVLMVNSKWSDNISFGRWFICYK